eukprot:gene28824-28267_t
MEDVNLVHEMGVRLGKEKGKGHKFTAYWGQLRRGSDSSGPRIELHEATETAGGDIGMKKPKKGKKAAVPKKVVSLDGCTGCSPFDARNGGGDDTSDALFMFRLVMGGASKSKVVVCSTDSAAAAMAWIHSIKAVVFQA